MSSQEVNKQTLVWQRRVRYSGPFIQLKRAFYMYIFDLSDPAVNSDPFSAFARLREEDPIHWSPTMKAWIITRYEDVKRIALNNSEISAERLTPFFRSMPEARQNRVENLIHYLNHWMVFRDPPAHTRLRRLFNKAFTGRAVEALRPNIEETVSLLFDRMEKKALAGEPVDWIEDFAYRLPATVMMDLLGVPRDDLNDVKEWSDDIALFIGTSRATANKYLRAEAGAKAMAAYFRALVDERSAEPRDDMVSQLVLTRDEQEALSADEVIATCILLLFAGHETTTNLIGNGFYYSMKFGDEWERVKAKPDLIESAIEEWLRYDGPSGAIARVIATDMDFGRRTLKEGQRVFAFLNSANRDPEAFVGPDTFDLGRTPNPHLTFGRGIHFCLGAPLARLEGQIALRQLIERFPNVRLADAKTEWHDSLILRGIKSIPVKLH